MGMYDREPNFEDTFREGDRFVLTGMEYAGSIPTQHGSAEKVLIQIVSRDHPDTKRTYSALGAGFAALAKRALPADFPHVAQYVRMPLSGDRTLKTFAPVTGVTPAEFIREGKDGDELGAEWHPDVFNAPPSGPVSADDDPSNVGF